jgi:XTP/dITP diphosphohydrolase
MENAMIKACYYSRETGRGCIADDSGLEVVALGGAPGIRSSRFAGDDATDDENIEKLLEVLDGHTRPWNARFVCCAVYAEEGRVLASASGELRGEIIPERRGSLGFGYDPVFLLPDRGLTVAEIDMEEKNRISHRKVALEELVGELVRRGIV